MLLKYSLCSSSSFGVVEEEEKVQGLIESQQRSACVHFRGGEQECVCMFVLAEAPHLIFNIGQLT